MTCFSSTLNSINSISCYVCNAPLSRDFVIQTLNFRRKCYILKTFFHDSINFFLAVGDNFISFNSTFFLKKKLFGIEFKKLLMILQIFWGNVLISKVEYWIKVKCLYALSRDWMNNAILLLTHHPQFHLNGLSFLQHNSCLSEVLDIQLFLDECILKNWNLSWPGHSFLERFVQREAFFDCIKGGFECNLLDTMAS